MKKRADGRYCKQILVGYRDDGRRIVKNIYGFSLKEIEIKERALRSQIENGLNAALKNNITVAEWANLWLKTYKNTVSIGTKNMYSNAIRAHIAPAVGNTPMNKVKPVVLQNLLNKLNDAGKTRTAEIVKLTLEQIFKQAVIEGFITYNPAQSLKSIKHTSSEKRILTEYEIKAINNADLTDKQRLFINIMRCCGLRKGEALALTVQDINLNERTLSVNKSLFFNDKISIIKEPKSKAGYRTIPLIDSIYAQLKAYIAVLNGELLFPMKNGNYMTRSSYTKFWKGILKKINEKADSEVYFTAHICRHPYVKL